MKRNLLARWVEGANLQWNDDAAWHPRARSHTLAAGKSSKKKKRDLPRRRVEPEPKPKHGHHLMKVVQTQGILVTPEPPNEGLGAEACRTAAKKFSPKTILSTLLEQYALHFLRAWACPPHARRFQDNPLPHARCAGARTSVARVVLH